MKYYKNIRHPNFAIINEIGETIDGFEVQCDEKTNDSQTINNNELKAIINIKMSDKYLSFSKNGECPSIEQSKYLQIDPDDYFPYYKEITLEEFREIIPNYRGQLLELKRRYSSENIEKLNEIQSYFDLLKDIKFSSSYIYRGVIVVCDIYGASWEIVLKNDKPTIRQVGLPDPCY